ncbi:hypothetical protein D3C72_932720 [compost metagenome]
MLGLWPMAMKTPSMGLSVTSLVTRLCSITWVTLSPARDWMSWMAVFQMNSILGLARARSCMILEARRVSRRCTT